MAFIQCECGSKLELSTSALRVTCPGCGKRFTVPQIEEPSVEESSGEVALAAVPAGISATMMQDLPVVTQFENHYAQSILAVGMFTSHLGSSAADAAVAAVGAAAGVAPLAAAADADPSAISTLKTPVANRSTRNTKRRSDTGSHGDSSEVQLQPGQFLLERYEVGRKIGQGGMSSVYEAHDHIRGEPVALKFLLPHLASKPKLQERFLQEGRLSSNFSHPNIARVYDLHQTDAHILLSMELLHGSTLRHDMHRRKTQGQSYRPAEVVSILKQVCEALAVVHASDIVHRDLKPENLWLGLDGTVKVMDFGIARDSVRGAHTTGPRGSGTPYYIAPEQLSASPTLDHRADQYSLAIIAYELLTGELPQGAIAPPHVKQPSIPKKLSQAIFCGLSADPNQRYGDIRKFQAALNYQRRIPLVAQLAIGALAVSGLGAGGYAVERWGLPLLETKVSPVWAEVAAKQVVEGDTVHLSLRHPDCTLTGKSLQYKLLSDAPAGSRIDASTGEFEWTPTEAQGPKDYAFNIMAVVEDQGRPPMIEERPVSISVKEAFNAPIFDTPEPITVKENSSMETSIAAKDPNEPKVGLVYELIDPPAGMTIDERSGLIKWTPREDMGSTHHSIPVRVALAGDEHRDIATVRKLNVHVEEAIDSLVFTSPDRLSAEVNVPLKHRVLTRDPNTPTLNTYYRLKGGDRLGMILEPKTGELQWTPTEDVAGKNFDVTVEALWDGAGKTEVVGSQTLKFTVADYTPPKPEVPPQANPQTTPQATAPVLASSSSGSGLGGAGGLGGSGLGSGGLGGSGLGGGTGAGGSCPSGAGAGGRGNAGGNGVGNRGNNGGGNGGGNGGTCNGNGPLGNGQLGNGQVGGIIVDIVGAAVAAHHQKEQAGQGATASGNAPQLPAGNLPINNLPVNKIPTNKLPPNKLPVLQPNHIPTPANGNTGINGGRAVPPQVKIAIPTFPQNQPAAGGNHSHHHGNHHLNNRGNNGGNNNGQGFGNSLKQKVEQELRARQGGNWSNSFGFKS